MGFFAAPSGILTGGDLGDESAREGSKLFGY